jgi:hypothetical protein
LTAGARATTLAADAEATRAGLEALGEEARAATADAFAPMLAELPRYGVDPSQGRPGWIHPPVTLEVDGYHEFDYANQFMGTVAADFVVSADITWDTQYGGSGCGFVLRSDGNQPAFNQYLVVATRAASGHVLFGTMSNGELVGGQDLYAYGADPQFDWQNGAVNRLTIVGRGNLFTIFTNGTRIGEVNPNDPPPLPIFPPAPEPPEDKTDAQALAAYARAEAEYEVVVNQIQANYAARINASKAADKEFDRGFTAMVLLSESGQTRCEFENAWLWVIEE